MWESFISKSLTVKCACFARTEGGNQGVAFFLLLRYRLLYRVCTKACEFAVCDFLPQIPRQFNFNTKKDIILYNYNIIILYHILDIILYYDNILE